MKPKIASLLMLTAALVPSPPASGFAADYGPGESLSHPDAWPPRLVELAKLPSRVAGCFINQDDYLAFRGDTAGFRACLDTCAALGESAPTTLHIHKGKGSFQPLDNEKKPVPCDWRLEVINQHWRSGDPTPKGPMYRLELHVWLDGGVDFATVKVPPNVKTIQENEPPAAGQAAAAPASDRELELEQQLMKTRQQLDATLAAQAMLAKELEIAKQAAATKGKPEESPPKSPPFPADSRLYPATELFINNHKFGDDNGSTASVAANGQSTCGHPGHVSEVTWKYLHSDSDGDVYQITRSYPSDAPSAKSDTKEITYAGKALVLWQDDTQKIILRPQP